MQRPNIVCIISDDTAPEFLGFEFSDGLHWNNADINHAKKMHVHNVEWTTQCALDFLETTRQDDRPFLLYLATTIIHGPDHRESLAGDPRITSVGILDPIPTCHPPRETIEHPYPLEPQPFQHSNTYRQLAEKRRASAPLPAWYEGEKKPW